jgi:predicted O-linked N-acetylglucosamine transferase (SPINDLY family)
MLARLDEAVAWYRRALQLRPDYPEAVHNLGHAFKVLGKIDEAAACYRRTVELQPDNLSALASLAHARQQACDWESLTELARRVVALVEQADDDSVAVPASPFFFLALPTVTTAEQQLRCARQWVARLPPVADPPARHMPTARPLAPRSKLNIGYLSSDYHAHATAFLIAELLEKHDRDRFAVYGYSFGPDDRSPMRQRLIRGLDRFVDLAEDSPGAAAQRIAADEIDILVDLKGYTQGARTSILALRPAPLQVNYLGYPGTMGAAFMDYILVDDFVVPEDQHACFTEKLVHLPGCYQVNDGRREISPYTPSRAECGLPDQGFVFCSFNNNYKITPKVFGVWMNLLKSVPQSVLWLWESNRYAPVNLRKHAETQGIAAERLVFAPRLPLAEHLARLRLADLFLDTFPVNAHTTASDALWAGCPVLSIAGNTFVSRVAGSLLHTLGLPELITTSLDAYAMLALRLAQDARQLAELRVRLAAGRAASTLFDGGRFAQNLERAYLRMWEIYAAGEKPRAIRVTG